MPSVAFYNSETFPDGQAFESPKYEEAYSMFAEIFAEHGGTLYIVRGLKNYSGENSFDAGWTYTDGKWIAVGEPFSVDLIFNKGSDLPLDQVLRVINHPDVSRLCLKEETAKRFPNDCPETFRLDAAADLSTALTKMKTDTVVIKPIDSYGGKGIFIVQKEDVAAHIDEYPVLLQEYIDMSKGIPGLAESHHDLRLTFIGDSLVACYLRQPPAGKLLSNVAQGGSLRQIPLDRIPQGARALGFKVDKAMADYPSRTYSVDMGLHSLREWKIIELNAPPGMPTKVGDRDPVPYMRILARHLATHAKD